MSSMKNIPSVDLSSITNTMQRAMNILLTTNQIATESMQSLLKKNSEIIQNNVNTILNTTKEAANSKDFKQASKCHQKCLKSIYETSMDNSKELASIAYESSTKILEAANKHIAENVHHASNKCRIWQNKYKKTSIRNLLNFQRHCERLKALLHGSKNAFDVIPAKAGIQKKAKLFELLILLLDSRFRRNDIVEISSQLLAFLFSQFCK
nr:phasin family protein [Rickettsia endosymbiont of Ixodes pacificus]